MLSNNIIVLTNEFVNKKEGEIVFNVEIRNLMRKKRLRQYEVAQALQISEFTFSRWLRDELLKDKKEKILSIIEEIEI